MVTHGKAIRTLRRPPPLLTVHTMELPTTPDKQMRAGGGGKRSTTASSSKPRWVTVKKMVQQSSDLRIHECQKASNAGIQCTEPNISELTVDARGDPMQRGSAVLGALGQAERGGTIANGSDPVVNSDADPCAMLKGKKVTPGKRNSIKYHGTEGFGHISDAIFCCFFPDILLNMELMRKASRGLNPGSHGPFLCGTMRGKSSI